jgi:hypothetical protein
MFHNQNKQKIMKKLFSAFAIIVPLTFFSQTEPVLKVYINTKEVSKPDYTISAYAKMGKEFIPILDTGGKKITVPKGIDISKIQSFKFIVSRDTIEFSVDKVLEDPKRAPDRSPMDDLREILTAIKTWDLRIDNFRYSDGDLLANKITDGKPTQNATGKKSTFKEYKIYALRTKSLKYYIVKN